jgi:hypothetical protein
MKRTAFTVMTAALVVVWAAAAEILPPPGGSQENAAVIATIHLPRAVMADGAVLPAGTYRVRLTGDQPVPATGQSAGGERWVEFLKNGIAAGREVATVVSAADIEQIAKGPQPRPDTSRVDVLKGGDYVRVWINRAGTHYIVHMPPAS